MNFEQFVQTSGLLPRQIIADGRIHRCGTVNHPRSTNGAYMYAGDHGWCMSWEESDEVKWWSSNQEKQVSEYDKKLWLEQKKKLENQRKKAQQEAAKNASVLLSKCHLHDHPYLKSKQLPNEFGLVYEDGSLFIPMSNCTTNLLTGLQKIYWSETEEKFIKKFIPGMRASESIYKIGQGKKHILVEGYATGLSVYMAARKLNLDVSIVCCFSANNVVNVAKKLGNYIMTDNDISKAGEKSAIKTGLPWCMPDKQGFDFNDVHANEGIFEVCKSLQGLIRKVA